MSTTTIQVGETFESNDWRVHRFANCIRITHIRDAGKRGKVCRQVSLYNLDRSAVAVDDIATNIRMHAESDVAWEGMVAAARGWEPFGIPLDFIEHKAVYVERASEAFKLRSDLVEVEATSREFVVRDLKDEANRQTIMTPTTRGLSNAKAFYAWAVANREVLGKMTFSEISRDIRAVGISAHYFCAMD